MTSVLVVGVAVIDFVMNVEQIPTKPEKYRAHDARIVGGGCAANSAVAICRLGGSGALVSRLGRDEVGQMILSDLRGEGVNCEHVETYRECRSSFSSVLVDRDGERLIVNYRDPDLPDTSDWAEKLDRPFDAVLADTRWAGGANRAMELAREWDVPGVVDAEAPLGGCETALETASHVMFSAQGLRAYSGEQELEAAVTAAQKQLGNTVGVTDGDKQVIWHAGDEMERADAFKVRAVDTLGAGDVWHGAFTLALAEGVRLNHAVKFANAAAALKCAQPGGRAGTPRRRQTDEFLRNFRTCS